MACVFQGHPVRDGSAKWLLLGPLDEFWAHILASFLYEWYRQKLLEAILVEMSPVSWRSQSYAQLLQSGRTVLGRGVCAQLENCAASCLKYNIKSVPLISALRKGH